MIGRPKLNSMLQRTIFIAMFIMSLITAGCVSPAPEEPIKTKPVSSVVAALVTDAQVARKGRNYNQAAAQLERALRIEPANPMVWHELAVVHVEQGSFEQAVQFAAKSNSLAQDRQLRIRNWQLMANAYSELGNDDLAREAQRQARQQ